MLFQSKVSEEFADKVIHIADKLNINPDWLMFIMYSESGLKSDAINGSSGATGLIQFMPNTAESLGTTTEQLKRMSDVDQLDFVEDYLSQVFKTYGTPDNVTELYLAIFYPAAIVWPDGKEFPEEVYKANKIFDYNNDGKLTKVDFINYVSHKYNLATGADAGIITDIAPEEMTVKAVGTSVNFRRINNIVVLSAAAVILLILFLYLNRSKK